MLAFASRAGYPPVPARAGRSTADPLAFPVVRMARAIAVMVLVAVGTLSGAGFAARSSRRRLA